MKYTKLFISCLALVVCACASVVRADEPLAPGESKQPQSASDLAKLKQNPVSGLRQVIFQTVVNPDIAGSDKTQSIYSIQPVFPININEDWKLITYTILPVMYQPGLDGADSNTGLGDTLINLFVSPKKPGKVVWGVGPAIMLPTRTDPALGSDRLGLGPTGVVFYAKDAWSAGLVLQNVWSLGGEDGNKVNTLGAQYIFNYNLADGWFLLSNATISANWLKDQSDRWTIPVGGGLGRVFNIGKQAVSLSAQAFYNIDAPSSGSDVSGMVQFTFLFP